VSKFDRYLLSQLLVLFSFFALSIVAIYWINLSVDLFDKIVGSGHDLSLFFEISFLSLPNLIATVLPIAAFISTIYAINRFLRESELLIMQSTGMSAFQIARPVMIFGLIVTLMSLILMNIVSPYSETVKINRYKSIAQTATSKLLTVGKLIHPEKNQTLYIREISADGQLHDIFLNDQSDPLLTLTYSSKNALFIRTNNGPKLVMLDGMAQFLNLNTGVLGVTKFSSFTVDLQKDNGSNDKYRTPDLAEISTWNLIFHAVDLTKTGRYEKGSIMFEAHNRIAQPLQGLTVSLLALGAMLIGGFSRFSLWRQIGLAIAIMIVLHLVNTTTMGIVRRNWVLWPLTYTATFLGTILSLSAYAFVGRKRHPGRARLTEVKPE
jgi:lipopolysaccharide export system permease protein